MMVIRPHVQQWRRHLSRKEAENWDNEQTIIYGRRMAITRARGEYPKSDAATIVRKSRQEVADRYVLSELTDGWLITKLCDPSLPEWDQPTYRYVNGILLKNGRVVRT